jgi:hypothetical protein
VKPLGLASWSGQNSPESRATLLRLTRFIAPNTPFVAFSGIGAVWVRVIAYADGSQPPHEGTQMPNASDNPTPEAVKVLALFAWFDSPDDMSLAARATGLTVDQINLAISELLARGFIDSLAQRN